MICYDLTHKQTYSCPKFVLSWQGGKCPLLPEAVPWLTGSVAVR